MRSILFSVVVLSACAAQQPSNTDAVKSSSEPTPEAQTVSTDVPEKAPSDIAPSEVAPVALDGAAPVDPAAAPVATDPAAAPVAPATPAPAAGTESKDGSEQTVD